MEIDLMFQQRVQNSLLQATNNPYMHAEVREAFKIMPNFYFLQLALQGGQWIVHALCFDDGYSARLFLDSSAFRMLVLDPMTEGVKQAIKDYHSIGHGG